MQDIRKSLYAFVGFFFISDQFNAWCWIIWYWCIIVKTSVNMGECLLTAYMKPTTVMVVLHVPYFSKIEPLSPSSLSDHMTWHPW